MDRPVALIRVSVQQEPFDVSAEVARCRSASTEVGGVVDFLGVARGTSQGKQVVRLEFEAYREVAERELEAMAREAAERFGLLAVTVVHRLGILEAGEPIVLIATAGVHRAEAFEGTRWCIDELKKRIPIWKKEVYADGAEWVQENP